MTEREAFTERDGEADAEERRSKRRGTQRNRCRGTKAGRELRRERQNGKADRDSDKAWRRGRDPTRAGRVRGQRRVSALRQSPGHLGPPSPARGASLNLGCPQLAKWELLSPLSFPPLGPSSQQMSGSCWTHCPGGGSGESSRRAAPTLLAVTSLLESREAQGRRGPVGGARATAPKSESTSASRGRPRPGPAACSLPRVQLRLPFRRARARISVLCGLALRRAPEGAPAAPGHA